MVEVSKNILTQLSSALESLNNEEYTMPLDIFSGASTSQHVRHILEFYLCVLDSDKQNVNFDVRKRDLSIEQNIHIAQEKIAAISNALDSLSKDTHLLLTASLGGKSHTVQSSLLRELLYVVEHAVHHMAIIKMGLMLHFPHIKLETNFGVAESTIVYRDVCAQ